VVRQAAADLAKFGLKIEALTCHPEVFANCCCDFAMQIGWFISGDERKRTDATYCGIPIREKT
jgi:hypothetical protein